MADELPALVAAWQRAWFAKDARTIDESLAPDDSYVAPDGHIMDRATILRYEQCSAIAE